MAYRENLINRAAEKTDPVIRRLAGQGGNIAAHVVNLTIGVVVEG